MFQWWPMSSTRGIESSWLDAAERVLAHGGIGALTAERVAAEAGVSRVTLHRRGVRRSDLVHALVQRAADDMRASVLAAVVGRSAVRERLAEALGGLCAVAERHRVLLASLYSVPDPGRDSGRPSGYDFAEPFERLALDLGVGGDDAPGWAELAVNATTWTYVHLRVAHGWPERRARDAVTAMVLASAESMARSADPLASGRSR